jgi:GNAT superfamily N-acetyltransferase
MPNDYTLVPLTNDRADETVQLVVDCFPEATEQKEYIHNSIHGELHPEDYKEFLAEYEFSEFDSQLLIKDDVVIGMTGLYRKESPLYQENDNPENTRWLNWLCVKPDERGHGYGSMLFDLSMGQAIDQQRQALYIWTSEDKTEKRANEMYDKAGAVVVKREQQDDWIELTKRIDLT